MRRPLGATETISASAVVVAGAVAEIVRDAARMGMAKP
jgi:hypothetical protein